MKTMTCVLVACIACVVLAACATTTADMLARPGLANGPSAGPDFGLIRYAADGSAADLEARQEDANRQMSSACGGRYRVLGKGSRSQLALSPTGRFGRGVMAGNESYVYIKFVCARA